MAYGFSSGGSDFYTGIMGRSITNMNSNNPSQPSYRTQLSQVFLDPTSQIAQHQTSTTNFNAQSVIGKRSLADFQAHQQQLQQPNPNLNPALNGLLRSVKPRMYQHTSPISTLSPIELSVNMASELPSLSRRYGMPLLQQLRPHTINLGPGPTIHSTNHAASAVPHMNTLQLQNRGVVIGGHESKNKMMNRLQELEKELLDDNEDEEGDAVSVITNTSSEWSETIQNLITSSTPNPISPSPSSSSSSSSSSSTSVTTPHNCSRQTLLDAASAIYEGKNDVACEILTRVSQVLNPRGNLEHRLMEYMLMALKSRVNPVENPPPVAELYSKEHVSSTQLLYELSPCFKLGFMAANLAILEATVDQPNTSSSGFHVIDFDIGQGCQYLNLLHALSERMNGKPSTVKITAVADNIGEEKERLKVVGSTLSQLAERFGVSLRFNVVSCKFGELSRESLGCDPEEPLAVNFAFNLYRMPDESVSTENPRDELLRRVKRLTPCVVTLVEQELNTNTAPFMARANEVISYYGALFESIESTVQRENSERVKVEEGLGRKLANSVACEGRERVERCEVFGKWRARMGMAGFELKPLSQKVTESMKGRLSSGKRVNPGFTVKEEHGGVSFGWMGKTLTFASAWS